MDKSLRLRLVVRRNGLPDVRIVFNISLADDPTIANLLEQINDDVPLEDAHGQWGLEDYAVELHGKGGQAFECLHFQPVASLLDKDDEVFIRPLMTVDLKKRRLAGRDQILHGGEHLIDGVPFGRNRLRIPRGRPSISIAPRKRRRLTYHGDVVQPSPEDYMDEDFDPDLSEEDWNSREQQEDEQDPAPLLITHRGEARSRSGVQHVRFPPGVGSSDELEDMNLSQEDDSEEESRQDEEVPSSSERDDTDDVSEPEPDLEEMAAELEDLRALAAEEDEDDMPIEDTQQKSGSVTSAQSQRSARSLSSLAHDRNGDPEQFAKSDLNLSGPLMDKITAVRFAFPQVSPVVCGQLLIKHNLDVSKAWHILAKTIKPRQGLAETMVFSTQLELPQQIQVVSSSSESNATQVFGEVSRIGGEIEDGGEEDVWPGEREEEADEEDDADDEPSHVGDDHVDLDDGDGDSDEAPEEISAKSTQEAQFQTGTSTRNRLISPFSDSGTDSDDEAYAFEAHRSQGAKSHSPASQDRNFSPVEDSSSSSSSGSDSSDSSDSSDEDETAPGTDTCQGRESPSAPLSSTNTKRSSLSKPTETQAEKSTSPLSEQSRQESSSESSFESSSESDSETSSTSSSDSRSDTDSEPIRRKRRSAKAGKPTPSENNTTQVPQVPNDNFVAAHQPESQFVPPGQGKIRTQKRNLRRRLQNQRKKAALQDSVDLQSTTDAVVGSIDLVAKKEALLQMLGNRPSTPPAIQDEVIANTDGISLAVVDKTGAVSELGSDEPDAWKRKILYRAVECVQEGIQLSEPPFPFKQRWDPQQRWEYQRGSHGRGKRKSRDDAQFYDGANQHGIKKQKASHNNAYLEKTTRPLDYEEDVVLDYDDAPAHVERLTTDEPRNLSSELGHFWADESNWLNNGEDDLPSLPEDISSLPKLTTDNLFPGSIIAWKQLLCTEATNWQPQISQFMTATVTQVHSDGENIQVQLAKRDRAVDKNERKFDEETGQRIYGKFEVPDEDEDEALDEDEGVRNISLSQMIDACLMQQRTSIGPPGQMQSEHDVSESTRVADTAEADCEVANTQSTHNLHSKSSKKGSDKGKSETLDHKAHEHLVELGPATPSAMDVEVIQDSANADDSLVPDRSPSRQLEDEDADNMLTSERNPSRQLEEEYASSIHPSYPADMSHRESSEAPSEYMSRDISQDGVQQTETGTHELGSPRRQLSRQTIAGLPMPDSVEALGLVISPEEYYSVGTDPQKIDQPKTDASQDTLPSDQIGRQLDPNFVTHSYELGTGVSHTSSVIHGFDEGTGPIEDGVADEQDGEPGTLEKVRDNGVQRANTATATKAMPFNLMRGSPAPSSPGSEGSTGSSSIFPDIEFLGSQPAKIEFKVSPKKIKNEPLGYEDEPSGLSATVGNVNDAALDASVSPPPVTRQRSLQRRVLPSSPPGVVQGSNPPAAIGDVDDDELSEDGGLVEQGAAFEEDEDEDEDADANADAEPIYTEIYADDSKDGDYEEDSVGGPPNQGASSPVMAETRRTLGAPGSQRPSRKASGRYGRRWTVSGL